MSMTLQMLAVVFLPQRQIEPIDLRLKKSMMPPASNSALLINSFPAPRVIYSAPPGALAVGAHLKT